MTLETYTIEQLQAEIERRNAADDEARLFFANVLEAWDWPFGAGRILDNDIDDGDRAAIALIAKKLADVRQEYIQDMGAPKPKIVGRAEKSEHDWIEWNGGGCPVDGDVCVEVKCRNGQTYEPWHPRDFTQTYKPWHPRDLTWHHSEVRL